MRVKIRAFTPAFLASLLLGMTNLAAAANKIKIEIVEATAIIGLVPHASPATPEQIRTHCDTRVDVNCVSTVTPATEPSVALLPTVLIYEAKAILPDGSHATLTCVPSRWAKKCKMVDSTGAGDGGKCYMEAVAGFAANQSLTTGTTYNLIVQAVGQPMITNHVTNNSVSYAP
jgi:hypothetical protein